MRINLGLIRTFGFRAAPTYNLLALTMVLFDIPPKGVSLFLLFVAVALVVLLDFKVMFSQEQNVYFKKNPEFQKMLWEIKEIRRELRELSCVIYARRDHD